AARPVRNYERDKFPFFPEHANLANSGFLSISRLDILGLDLLAALGLDQGGETTEQVKLAIVIKVTQVAGSEPSIFGKGLASLVWKIAIAAEDIWSARNDFADLMPIDALLLFERARFNTKFDPGNGFSRAVWPRLVRQLHRKQRRSLGEPVADSDLPAERFKFPSQLGIERRAAGSKEQVVTKTFVQRAKQ